MTWEALVFKADARQGQILLFQILPPVPKIKGLGVELSPFSFFCHNIAKPIANHRARIWARFIPFLAPQGHQDAEGPTEANASHQAQEMIHNAPHNPSLSLPATSGPSPSRLLVLLPRDLVGVPVS
jgi:hypothetical protein